MLFAVYYFQIDANSEDIQIVPVNEYCQSNRMTWFVGFIYAYKGLLMVSRRTYYVYAYNMYVFEDAAL